MTNYQAHWRADATGPGARYAGRPASLVYTDREALEKVIAASPNAEQYEIREVGA